VKNVNAGKKDIEELVSQQGPDLAQRDTKIYGASPDIKPIDASKSALDDTPSAVEEEGEPRTLDGDHGIHSNAPTIQQ
jgi:hypothetical protein